MKMTVKKVLVMVMVICMALAMFLMPMSAAVTEVTDSTYKIKWSYDDTTNVMTITSIGASYITKTACDSANGWGVGRYAEIKEIVFKNDSGNFKIMEARVFGGGSNNSVPQMTALTRVTIPETVTKIGNFLFYKATSFKELVVEGNAYIPGAVDLSNITETAFSQAKHRTFNDTAIETIIFSDGFNAESNPIVSTNGSEKMLGASLKTIMGPFGDEYLKSVAAANNCNYVPYGKIGAGTAWIYDEATNTVTIYGNGTSSALTELSSDDVTNLKGATKVVIRADITSIDVNALAGLTNLKEVEFLGNAPATAGNPFGAIKGLVITIPDDATGFEDGFYGYDFSKPAETVNPTGTFNASRTKEDIDGAWEFDIKEETLYVWGEQENSEVNIPKLAKDAGFIEFASEYGDQVKVLKFRNKDGSVIVHEISSTSNHPSGFSPLPSLGLENIEKIFVGGETTKEVLLTRFEDMFNGLSKLTTFGREGTTEGTVDLNTVTFDGGAANGAFSGQVGINKVVLPSIRSDKNAWGPAFTDNTHTAWPNIPANYFKGMTGLTEVVLSSGTTGAYNLGTHFSGTCMIGANAFDGCTNLKSLTIPATTPASAAFRKSDGKNEYTVDLFNENSFAGSSIETVYIWNPDAAVVAEYNIPDVVKIICANDATKAAILEDTTANVFCILTGIGVSVRYKDYNGLRNIYDFNDATNKIMSGYTLVEYGAMLVSASKLGDSELTIDPWTSELSVADAVNKAVWSNNTWEGKVLSYTEGVKTQFALTLTYIPEVNYDDGVYSRAYAIYQDANGNRFVAYANNNDEKAISLYDAMVSGCQQGVLNNRVCDDAAVWSVFEAGKVENGDIEAGEGILAMVINGKDKDADVKVLVVGIVKDGTVGIDDAKTAATNAAAEAGFNALDNKIIALCIDEAFFG